MEDSMSDSFCKIESELKPDMSNVENELLVLKRRMNQLQTLLAYCKIEIPEDDAQAGRLLRTALALGGLEPLVDQCAQVLDKSLNARNVINYFKFATEKDVGELNNATRRYILNNFKEVYNQEDWLTLRVEDLKWFLNNDELNAPEEEDVFKALLLWVRKDKNRNAHVEALMLSAVRLYLCDLRFLSSTLKDHFMLWDKETFQKNLTQVISEKENETPELQEKINAAKRTPQN